MRICRHSMVCVQQQWSSGHAAGLSGHAEVQAQADRLAAESRLMAKLKAAAKPHEADEAISS